MSDRAALLLLALVCGLLGSCRQETPLERGRRLFRSRQKSRFSAAAMETTLFARLSDGQSVRANQREGLGLAIRPQVTELRAGEPLRLHLIYANLLAREAVSAAACQGFSVTVEAEASGVPATIDLHPACPVDDPFRDDAVTLRHGQVRTVDVSTAGTKLIFDHPGRYLVQVAWQSYRPAEGMFPNGSEQGKVWSNEVLVTVKNAN